MEAWNILLFLVVFCFRCFESIALKLFACICSYLAWTLHDIWHELGRRVIVSCKYNVGGKERQEMIEWLLMQMSTRLCAQQAGITSSCSKDRRVRGSSIIRLWEQQHPQEHQLNNNIQPHMISRVRLVPLTALLKGHLRTCELAKGTFDLTKALIISNNKSHYFGTDCMGLWSIKRSKLLHWKYIGWCVN